MIQLSESDRLLLVECWETWGEDSQVDQTIEECAELIAALIQFKRGRIGIREVATEIADSMIMLSEFNLILEDVVDEEFESKMSRLRNRMNKWKLEQQIKVEG